MIETDTDAVPYKEPNNLGGLVGESFLSEDYQDLYYDMTGEKYMIIFNHYEFQETRYFGYQRPKDRIGTIEDVIKLTQLFDDMGYRVIVHDDLEYIDIIQKMKDITSRDHKSTSCLCFAFLTHGGIGGDIYAADRPYHFQEITDMFGCSHSSLVGKPKILFVQACRGTQADSGRRLQLDGDHVHHIIPTHADVLVLYASVEGHMAIREDKGSIMIQELCTVIREHYEEWDILHITTFFHNKLAFGIRTDIPEVRIMHEKKQMPETQNSLTKFFKF